MTWHQTVVVGRLGGDPELRYLQSGDAVCNFRVAVNERKRDRQTGDWYDATVWYGVSVWGNQAESCNTYLSKGSQVVVVGNVSARGYINNNGEAAAGLNLTARNVRFLGGRGDGEGYQGGEQQQGGRQQGGQQRGNQQQGGRQGSYRDERASNYTEPPSTVDDIPF